MAGFVFNRGLHRLAELTATSRNPEPHTTSLEGEGNSGFRSHGRRPKPKLKPERPNPKSHAASLISNAGFSSHGRKPKKNKKL